MSTPVDPSPAVAKLISPAEPEPRHGRFAQALARAAAALPIAPPAPSAERVMGLAVAGWALEVTRSSSAMNGLIADAMSGRHLGNAKLLALQAQMQQHSLELQLLSKLAEQVVEGLRMLLRTQV